MKDDPIIIVLAVAVAGYFLLKLQGNSQALTLAEVQAKYNAASNAASNPWIAAPNAINAVGGILSNLNSLFGSSSGSSDPLSDDDFEDLQGY
jgi:hypothetical protein